MHVCPHRKETSSGLWENVIFPHVLLVLSKCIHRSVSHNLKVAPKSESVMPINEGNDRQPSHPLIHVYKRSPFRNAPYQCVGHTACCYKEVHMKNKTVQK